MHLRLFAFVCALLALGAAPTRPAPEPLVHRSAERVRGAHEQPLPFLGSGGAVVQVAATESTAGLAALRAAGPARARLHVSARTGLREHLQPVSFDRLAVSVRACRLGTPPPASRSGRAFCPATPVQA